MTDDRWAILEGDCRDVLPTLAAASLDCVVTDPPYAEIDRPYGRLTEAAWAELLHATVYEIRRVLKPSGSAMLVLQPNSAHVGQMRPWLWEFLAWCCREWNVVQDCYWWNFTRCPTVHTNRKYGLMRPSVKTCVWIGPADCYRDQASVLWTTSGAMHAISVEDRALRRQPSGGSVRRGRIAETVALRGGVTPFNILPIANADSQTSAGALGHGAGTPLDLCRWWVRYLCPPGGTVCDPFSGSGTVGVAALEQGRRYVGVERSPEYAALSRLRLAATQPALAEAV